MLRDYTDSPFISPHFPQLGIPKLPGQPLLPLPPNPTSTPLLGPKLFFDPNGCIGRAAAEMVMLEADGG